MTLNGLRVPFFSKVAHNSSCVPPLSGNRLSFRDSDQCSECKYVGFSTDCCRNRLQDTGVLPRRVPKNAFRVRDCGIASPESMSPPVNPRELVGLAAGPHSESPGIGVEPARAPGVVRTSLYKAGGNPSPAYGPAYCGCGPQSGRLHSRLVNAISSRHPRQAPRSGGGDCSLPGRTFDTP